VRVAVLADEGAVAVAEVAMQPGAAPPPAPVDHLEAAYVLDGVLDLALPDRRVRADAGAWVTVPPRVPHAFEASAAVRYLRVRARAPPRAVRNC
jgi:quercetin dioxygenase-like cupin family protein